MAHKNLSELEAGLWAVLESPKESGRLELIVRRPDVDERELLEEGELDTRVGLVGDSWSRRRSSRTEDGSPHPDMQLNLMNARAIALLEPDRSRWPMAGDQLYLDMDLSCENLPPGSRLELGSAVIEVTAQPHTGCKKFAARFGVDAQRFVCSPEGRRLNLRGINARVVRSGVVRVGDVARRIDA